MSKPNFKTTCNNVFYNSTVILHNTVPFVLNSIFFTNWKIPFALLTMFCKMTLFSALFFPFFFFFCTKLCLWFVSQKWKYISAFLYPVCFFVSFVCFFLTRYRFSSNISWQYSTISPSHIFSYFHCMHLITVLLNVWFVIMGISNRQAWM